jgi:hypothetical protein
MDDDAGKPEDTVSRGARRWAARQEEFRAAVAADRERVLKTQAEQRNHIEQGYGNHAGFFLGLLALLLLFAAGWFIIDRMRCDPFYASISRLSSHTCQ